LPSFAIQLLRLGRQVEARDWLRSMMQVDRKYKITMIRDAGVKLLIKMAVKDEVEEADVVNMVELLSSPQDRLLARLDLSTHGIFSHPQLSSTLAMSFSRVLDLMAMSQNSLRKEEMLDLLLTCPWQGLSPSQQEDCMADREFFLPKLSKFAVKVAVSMNRYQLVADILSQGKVKDWLVEKDEDCFLSKLCWDVGLSCDSLHLKHSLLPVLFGQLLPSPDPAGLTACLATGQCSCWSDGCQEDGGDVHGAVHEAAGGGAGHAGVAGDQPGDAEHCPSV
jgi:hypothetical protein